MLAPSCRVAFLDTSFVAGAREQRAGDTLRNEGEAALVTALLRSAVAAGVPQHSLGVISPYRSQVGLIKVGGHVACTPARPHPTRVYTSSRR